MIIQTKPAVPKVRRLLTIQPRLVGLRKKLNNVRFCWNMPKIHFISWLLYIESSSSTLYSIVFRFKYIYIHEGLVCSWASVWLAICTCRIYTSSSYRFERVLYLALGKFYIDKVSPSLQSPFIIIIIIDQPNPFQYTCRGRVCKGISASENYIT